MKYEYANILPKGMLIEQYYAKLRSWLDKKVTRILDPQKQTLKSGEVQIYADMDGAGNTLIKHWFDVSIDLTQEQVTALHTLNTNPDLWVEEDYADRWSFRTGDTELINMVLEKAVPNKGLMYYGKHGDIGFNSLVPLTGEEKKKALDAWVAYGGWR